MTVARSSIVIEGEPGWYHCMSRCVRKARLFGVDPLTGKSYDHRKKWLKDRLIQLSHIFAIDVHAYAVMSNHFHIVVRCSPDTAESWSPIEVVKRWCTLFPKLRDPKGNPIFPEQDVLQHMASDSKHVEKIRARLASLSWFMRCLKENIARRANREDDCGGRFWEGRFKSVALLDEAALVACCAYVDLNPIRAGISETPETSDYTSIQDRISARQARGPSMPVERQPNLKEPVSISQRHTQENGIFRDNWLSACKPSNLNHRETGKSIPLTLDEYLQLVDWTGRQIRGKNKGVIPIELAPILDRLDIVENQWMRTVTRFNRSFYRVAGSVRHMRQAAEKAGQKWLKGMSSSAQMFKAA